MGSFLNVLGQADAGTKAQEAPIPAMEHLIAKGIDWLAEYGPRVLGAMVFLIVAWILTSWVSRIALRAMTTAKFDVTLTKFLANTIRWALLAVAAVAGLGIFGVQTASFTAVIGSAGLAIGLAMQGSLSNLAAGVMLLVFRPFRVGDTVTVAGQTGKVDEIELFSTRVDTVDNRRIIIPNGQVFGAIIENQSHHPTRAATLTVVVDGAKNVDETRAILLAAAEGTSGRLETPAPGVGLVKLVPGGVEWTVGVWAETGKLASVQQELAKSVKAAVDGHGLGMPAPSTVLRLPAGVTVTSQG